MGDELPDDFEAAHVSRPDGRRIAVAADRLADPSDRVQRRVAGGLSIRIGACFEQGGGQFEMSVFDGENERRGLAHVREFAVLWPHDFVDVGAGLKQSEHDIRASLADGEEQRRETGGERSAEVGSALRAGRRRLPGARRPRPTSARSDRAGRGR